MIAVNMHGDNNRLEIEMDAKVKNLMWVSIFSGKTTQFTSCRFDWQDWRVENNNLVSPSLVIPECGVFALKDKTDAAVVEQFLEDCKNAS